jgi:membrane-associated phospholipid phosphatase
MQNQNCKDADMKPDIYSRFRGLMLTLMLFAGVLCQTAAAAAPELVVKRWHGLVLELIRHTPTYSPPVASRALAYLGIASYEAVASGDPKMLSLAGQLNDFAAVPERVPGQAYDEAVVLETVLALGTRSLFENTGPAGQRAMAALRQKLDVEVARGVAPDIVERSQAYGEALARHIHNWSLTDGGSLVTNLGFPEAYALSREPANWVPTSRIKLQQMPLLPDWGKNRSFAMPSGTSCALPPPPSYSEDKSSAFYLEAAEVYDIARQLTAEQKAIARFWSDDAMLTFTPAGHWSSIALQIFARDAVPIAKQVEVLARLGIAQADAFIGCWNAKYSFNLLRPITYIRKNIDAGWSPLLNTPPFPEYPSGHSVQSAAAATVLTQAFGDKFGFDDDSYRKEKLPQRHFTSFHAAAQDAGLSRLYGGIHFRSAIVNGAAQGRCIAAYANALKTRP